MKKYIPLILMTLFLTGCVSSIQKNAKNKAEHETVSRTQNDNSMRDSESWNLWKDWDTEDTVDVIIDSLIILSLPL